MDIKRFILSSLFTKSAKIPLLFFLLISLAIASEHPASQVIIPTTAPEIFQEIDEYTMVLYKAIENNQLSEVHYHVFAVLKLVNALPNLSQSLSPAQLKMLQNSIASIKKLATQMDASSDANDQEATQAQFKKLRSFINELHTYYSIKKHVQ
ncbi:transporter [Legionella taurinensis]|uniref:transporter n=1 Tax=Legionella taurinensis TaxID=70611 RepID=UPI001A275CDF|nr:transporter [Legionella taurinensis]MDX1838156.1 transporter [Legionella taurinensis]HAU1025083.1 transporter [Legionella pneumophila]